MTNSARLRFVATLVVGTLLFAGFIVSLRITLDNTLRVGESHGVVQTPEEDEPGFDCRIHGNKICGPAGPVNISE